MSETILIQGGTLLTIDPTDRVIRADLLIENDRIVRIESHLPATLAETVLDARGCVILPGFVQTHVHLCQTLFRGTADDLSLLDWLKQRIWPMEAAHTPPSLRASARLGIAELIKGGTTCALTMETVRHTEEVFRAVEESGFRAVIGKCMMDRGDDVPRELREETGASIRESLRLLDAWHGRAEGRIRYCFAPRFAVSCTRELLEQVALLARERGVLVHTHASENAGEIAIVEQETGLRNLAYLDSAGLAAPHVVLAHCIHLDESELQIIERTETKVAHCPSSNMKLGSGIARVTEMLSRGISVSLGADGAPCNNRLDMFTEMRTAALLQKVVHGPEVLPASKVIRMATIEGACALGWDHEIGSLEIGKRADLSIVDVKALHSTPQPDLVSTVVYSAQSSDVRTVVVDGRIVMRERRLTTMDERAVIDDATREASLLFVRSGG